MSCGVDFAFYRQVYGGTSLREDTFPEAAARAADVLHGYARSYRVTGSEEDKAKAICAMAEAYYAASKRRSGVTAASVGEVSVHYGSSESADKTLQRQLYEKASIYLEISRGVA